MTGTEAELFARGAQADHAGYMDAILNILEDLTEERARQDHNERALINVLEDLETERIRLASGAAKREQARESLPG